MHFRRKTESQILTATMTRKLDARITTSSNPPSPDVLTRYVVLTTHNSFDESVTEHARLKAHVPDKRKRKMRWLDVTGEFRKEHTYRHVMNSRRRKRELLIICMSWRSGSERKSNLSTSYHYSLIAISSRKQSAPVDVYWTFPLYVSWTIRILSKVDLLISFILNWDLDVSRYGRAPST